MEQSNRRVIALGFFDGVHLGHGSLFRETVRLARDMGVLPCALTFDRHPESLIIGFDMPLINTLSDRIGLIRELYGIDDAIVARFDRALSEMPWRDFMKTTLVERLGAAAVVAGHDFHFGHLGEGNVENLTAYGRSLGLGVSIMPRVELEGITVSSTYIRKLIAQGDMDRAGRFLGHPYLLTGVVGHGRKVGATLGAPTLNIPLPKGIQCPAFGVYVSRVEFEGHTWPAVTNVGVRPTVSDGGEVVLETSILNFEGDLYEKTVRLSLYRFLRSERKFPSLDALKEGIQKDIEQARAFFRGP